MAQHKRDPRWVDMLWEKHECFGYDDPATLEIEHGGKRLRVLLPNYVPHAEILVAAESDHLLFLIGRQTRKVYDDTHFRRSSLAREKCGLEATSHFG